MSNAARKSDCKRKTRGAGCPAGEEIRKQAYAVTSIRRAKADNSFAVAARLEVVP
jgi:hypothetical protein